VATKLVTILGPGFAGWKSFAGLVLVNATHHAQIDSIKIDFSIPLGHHYLLSVRGTGGRL
jgi:hypothetical protein